jgi:hypothetical protein
MPIIDTTQSVLGYRAFERWAFQPAASGNVTGWTCTDLPAALTFNPATGKISGYVETPGVYAFRLIAWDDLTPSAAVRFVFGIDGAVNPAQVGTPLLIDTRTRAVGVASVASAGGALQFSQPSPLLRLKHSDDLPLSIRLVTVNGSAVEVQRHDVVSLKFALKSAAEEAVVLLADAFSYEIVGGDTLYSMNIPLTSTMLDSIMADDVPVTLQGEFQWEIVNPNTTGPQLLRHSSETFNVLLSNDIVE